MSIISHSTRKEYDADTIKLGLLKYYHHYKIHHINNGGGTISCGIDISLRGILYHEQDGVGKDLLYEQREYPIMKNQYKDKLPHLEIQNGISLTPLFEYFNMKTVTQVDLENIKKQILENKDWFRKHADLFGTKRIDMGPVHIKIRTGIEILPSAIYSVLGDAKYSFADSKKEEKLRQKCLSYRSK